MKVIVDQAGGGPGDYATVQLVTDYDGVNSPDVFELSVGLKAVPMGGPRLFSVELRAGDTMEFSDDDDDDERERPETLAKFVYDAGARQIV